MTVLDTLIADLPPIEIDTDGIARVGGTRVRLETVITAFHSGLCAEEILLKYPSLTLTDIYAVLAYYLRHRAEIDSILLKGSERIAESDREIEARFPSAGIRERLLSRRAVPPDAK